MRTFLAIVGLLWSSSAMALCQQMAELHTKTWSIDISDGGCGATLMITFSRNGGESNEVAFNSECKEFDEKTAGWPGFSCKSTGRSPMAGATYKLVRRGKPYCDPESPNEGRTPGYQYVCVKGCKNSVPKYLIGTHACD